MAGGRDGAIRAACEFGCDGTDQRGRNQWFIALHIDDNLVVRKIQLDGGLRKTVRAGGVVGACH